MARTITKIPRPLTDGPDLNASYARDDLEEPDDILLLENY